MGSEGAGLTVWTHDCGSDAHQHVAASLNVLPEIGGADVRYCRQIKDESEQIMGMIVGIKYMKIRYIVEL